MTYGLEAADQARKRHLHNEQLQMLDQVLEVWDRVPERTRSELRTTSLKALPYRATAGLGKDRQDRSLEGGCPVDRFDLMAEAVVAARLGSYRERALALTDDALAMADDDALVAAWFWTQRSLLVQDLALANGWTEMERARDLVKGLPPSPVHAFVLATVAGWAARHQPGPETLQTANRAVQFAEEVGAQEVAMDARITRGWLAAAGADYETGVAELYEVRSRAMELGSVATLKHVSINLPSALEGAGRSAEAVAVAAEASQWCSEHGLDNVEAWVRCNQSLSLYSLGRWEESEDVLAMARRLARSRKAYGLCAVRQGQMSLARGDLPEAKRQIASARAMFGVHDSQPQLMIHPAEISMQVAADEGRIADARSELIRMCGTGLPAAVERYSLPMLCTAAAIEADVRETEGPAKENKDVLALIRRHAVGLGLAIPIWRAYRLLLEAELGRAAGVDLVEPWAKAVAAFEAQEHRYPLALARGRWACALLAVGKREAGNELMRQALADCEVLGAQRLAEKLKGQASRMGLSPGSAIRPEQFRRGRNRSPAAVQPRRRVSQTLPQAGLTARERDVLELLALGHGNRRIGEELDISVKTVSIHVSSILAKLNASTRTEAATQALKRGLISD